MVRGISSLPLLLLLTQGALLASAQFYSDCHSHGNVEYCYGPDGEETPVTTHAPATATTEPSSVPASTTSSGEISVVTGCHTHSTQTFCIAPDGSEVQVTGTVTASAPPTEFTGCHSHGSDTYCMDPDGNEVQLLLDDDESHEHEEDEGDHGHEGENCHFHAGVEHCVGAGQSESESSQQSCERRDRDYNIPLRIGSLFVILVTSGIAVFGPVFFTRIFSKSINTHVFTVIKQFGTGIMLATAFIHLFTHASLMFSNPCLGALQYEATTAAIAMAGIFLTFLLEYLGNRVIIYKRGTHSGHDHEDESSKTANSNPRGNEIVAPPAPHQPNLSSLGHHHHHVEDKLSVLVMEAGIIFHSIIIGLTLVVAGDSAYISLFIVIIFHQAFEGLALGSRIAELTETSMRTKLLMSASFALITPLGMAIGLGVINDFNGNDKSTIVAIGTLDALSAGILAWAALVDMLCHDWVYGDLKDASALRTTIGMISLITGMVLMGLLGKWA
ncbi:hypothetical protein VTO42DRAFT_1281 [Malbranchea cinnamomea]